MISTLNKTIGLSISLLLLGHSFCFAKEGPSLDETLSWIKEKWTTHGTVTYNRGKYTTQHYSPAEPGAMSWRGCELTIRIRLRISTPTDHYYDDSVATVRIPLDSIDPRGLRLYSENDGRGITVHVKSRRGNTITLESQLLEHKGEGAAGGLGAGSLNEFAIFRFSSQNDDIAERVNKALKHAITFCAPAKQEPF